MTIGTVEDIILAWCRRSPNPRGMRVRNGRCMVVDLHACAEMKGTTYAEGESWIEVAEQLGLAVEEKSNV